MSSVDLYRLGQKPALKPRRKKRWLVLSLVALIVLIIAVVFFVRSLHPKTVIKQSKAVVTHTNYQGTTKHYDEGDFGIDLPSTWKPVARPVNTYQSFTWQTIDDTNDTDGQQIEIFEDTIPVNYAANRALIVDGEVDHIELVGQASDDCVNFTKNLTAGPNQTGVEAKWQGVDFLCNQVTTGRDTIGTSSTDGINTVNLKTSAGISHKFFFTYSDQQLSPDYSTFYTVLQSFKMN